ncbi:hypothetical protein TCAL_04232 [Tigriopus californicus]|uniref:CUB domain-containing protein n=1 Tax=Tigriopus californicus TaxID=6832 RepID=A0A553PLY7_TIGCA|nr:cubilin-like [Tigriopus californicus]TRY78688.1 hypothetical protein TCAL_04232 [Tigriopus californicus]
MWWGLLHRQERGGPLFLRFSLSLLIIQNMRTPGANAQKLEEVALPIQEAYITDFDHHSEFPPRAAKVSLDLGSSSYSSMMGRSHYRSLGSASRSSPKHALADFTDFLSRQTSGLDPNGDSMGCGFCRTDLREGDNGTVKSSNFPYPYPDNENCLWLLQTVDPDLRVALTCDTIHLESCGTLGKNSPMWKDYLIISPLWSFKKSWVYCGHATTMTALRHISLCDKMAIAFRSNENGKRYQGFHCTYQVFRSEEGRLGANV